MEGMDHQQPVGAGDETLSGAPAPPADPPEWSVPSRWMVPELEIRALPPPPPPQPVRQGPNRLTAALVVALVVAMATAVWAAFDRLDIHLSRPTLSAAPAPRPSPGTARP